MANLSFTSSGATPVSPFGIGGTKTVSPIGIGTQNAPPAAKALNTAQAAPAPSTPVKKTTVNNVDGSSHVTEYHAPATQVSSSSPTLYDSSDPLQLRPGETPQQYQSRVAMVQGANSSSGGSTSSQPTGTTATFPGLVSSLAKTSENGSQAARDYTAQTANYGAGNIPIGQNANAITDKYTGLINPIIKGTIGQEIGDRTTGTTQVGEGNAQLAAAAGGALIQGLTNQEQQELAGNSQGLTAQQQAANAANAAAGQANTGQGLAQSGLGAAGSLAQPQLGSIGQVPFSPTDMSQSSPLGAPGGSAADAASVAGQFQGAQAAAAAPGQAQASNIQAGGTAVTGANAQGLAQSIQQETALNTAASSATQLGTQVATAMQNAGINLTNSTDANTAINNLQSRLGNQAYTQLNIAVNDARSAYASILQSSGSATPTEAGNMANQNISANMSPKQILAAIDQLSQGVNARQTAAHEQTLRYQSQLSGSNNLSSNSGTGVVQTSAGAVNTDW